MASGSSASTEPLREVAEVVLECSEARDRLPPELEGRHPVGDALVGIGDDVEDDPAQVLQGGPPGFVEGCQVLVDLVR